MRGQVEETEAAERAARIASGELEVRLTEVRRAESGARAELQHLQGEQERAQRAAQQRADEQARATRRSETTRAELEAARTERAALTDTLRGLEDQVVAVTERASAARAALSPGSRRPRVDGRPSERRAPRSMPGSRPRSPARPARGSRRPPVARSSTPSRPSLPPKPCALGTELAALQRQLEPLDAELNAAAQARLDVVAERQAVEQRLAALRAAERAAHETARAAPRRCPARRGRARAAAAPRSPRPPSWTPRLAGGAAWAEQLRLQFDGERQHRRGVRPRSRATADRDPPARAARGRWRRRLGGRRIPRDERTPRLSRTPVGGPAARRWPSCAAPRRSSRPTCASASRRSSRRPRPRFRRRFVELFGGGEARLVLTDPDDLLRTGVDIVARPPGKKLQGLLSLSGGERALTVVALMFGPAARSTRRRSACSTRSTPRSTRRTCSGSRICWPTSPAGYNSSSSPTIARRWTRPTPCTASAWMPQGISHIFSVQPRAMAAAGRHPA